MEAGRWLGGPETALPRCADALADTRPPGRQAGPSGGEPKANSSNFPTFIRGYHVHSTMTPVVVSSNILTSLLLSAYTKREPENTLTIWPRPAASPHATPSPSPAAQGRQPEHAPFVDCGASVLLPPAISPLVALHRMISPAAVPGEELAPAHGVPVIHVVGPRGAVHLRLGTQATGGGRSVGVTSVSGGWEDRRSNRAELEEDSSFE
jgi:hypothetical protein